MFFIITSRFISKSTFGATEKFLSRLHLEPSGEGEQLREREREVERQDEKF